MWKHAEVFIHTTTVRRSDLLNFTASKQEKRTQNYKCMKWKFLSVYQCNIILFNKYSVHKLRTLIPTIKWVLLTGESQHIDWVTSRFLVILAPFVSHWPMPKFNASIVWSETRNLSKTRSLLWNIWWWYSQWAWSLKWPVCGWLQCFF